VDGDRVEFCGDSAARWGEEEISMARKVMGPTGSRRRRWLFLCTAVAAIATAVLFIPSAFAVHDEGIYQLDGNAQASDNSESPVMPSATEDADSICAGQVAIQGTTTDNAKGQFCHPATGIPLPAPTSSSRFAFVTDGSGPFAPSQGNVDDQYTGGSGDAQDLSAWLYKNAAPSNDKSDIQNAFAAEYTITSCPADAAHAGCHVGDKVMYFGGDRTSDSGDENTAFWFLQNPAVESPNGACAVSSGCPFTTDGRSLAQGGTLAHHVAANPGPDGCLANPTDPTKNINFVNPGTSCTENNGNPGTDGDTYGDILVVSAFTGGGVAPNVTAYEWIGSTPYATAKGADKSACGTSACTTIKILTVTQGCSATDSGDPACAITNQAIQSGIVGENPQPIQAPWIYSEKVGDNGQTGANTCTTAPGKMCPSIFLEAGLNLSALGLQSECTSTFVMDTRSSQSVSSSLQDLAVGQVGSCTSTTTTSPNGSTDGGTTYNPVDESTNALTMPTQASQSGGANPLKVTDTANIQALGGVQTFGGSVSFYLCGPSTTNTTNCNDPTPFSDTTDDPGVQIGSAKTVTGSAGAASVTSDAATLTSVGYYCWRAVYSGDSSKNLPGSSDPKNGTSRTECFRVKPVTPTLSTTASCSATPCVLSSSLSDTATLAGTAYAPGTNGIGPGGTINASDTTNPALGSITWHAYGPNSCSTIAAFGTSGTSRNVSGDGTYPQTGPPNNQAAVSFTPTAVGDYVFSASYSGNSPNTGNVPDSGCPDTSTGATETVTVTGSATLHTAQNWLPNDSANITSPTGTTLAGNVVFTLYKDADCGAGTGEGDADIAYGPITKNIPTDATGTAINSNVKTTNTTFFVTVTNDATAWSWKVTYTDTGGLNSPDPGCETTTPAFTLTDQ
jgi:hypothetical protein